MSTTENSKKKQAWKSDSVEGALLFLLIHKRICGDPDDFSASEIQNNPLYGFDSYSAQTFKRSCQTIANRVKKFEEKGTGLSKHFKEHIKEAKEKYSHLLVREEEEDGDYKDEEEEDDLSHISQGVDEDSVSDDLQDERFDTGPKAQPPVDKKNIISTSRRSGKKETPEEMPRKSEAKKESATAKPDENPYSYVVPYSDGRLIGVHQLVSGWDGSFCVSKDGMTVYKKTKLSSALFEAKTVLKRHGFDNNNIHIVNLQSAMDKRKEKLQPKEDNMNQPGRPIFHTEAVWKLPFPVRPKFCSIAGDEDNKVMIEMDDTTGVEWAYMFMVGVHVKDNDIEAPTIVRNRNRQRPVNNPPPPQPRGGPRRRTSGEGINAAGSFESMFVDAVDDDDLWTLCIPESRADYYPEHDLPLLVSLLEEIGLLIASIEQHSFQFILMELETDNNK